VRFAAKKEPLILRVRQEEAIERAARAPAAELESDTRRASQLGRLWGEGLVSGRDYLAKQAAEREREWGCQARAKGGQFIGATGRRVGAKVSSSPRVPVGAGFCCLGAGETALERTSCG